MLKKKLLKKVVGIGMMATMITGCSQEVQTTHVDGLNSYKNASQRWYCSLLQRKHSDVLILLKKCL